MSASRQFNPGQFFSPNRILPTVFLYSFIVVTFWLFVDFQSGGNAWKQGDWLINNENGAVRRGVFGDLVFYLSDAVHLSPLTVTVDLQLIFLVGLYLSFAKLCWGIERSAAALIAISPGLFLLFWAADTQGSLQKELLAYLALLLLALGLTRASRPLFALGGVVFCISVLSHEAMALFVPLILALALLAWRADIERRGFFLAGAVMMSLVAVAELVFSLMYAHVADPDLVCQPIVARGVGAEICSGAIAWLSLHPADGIAAVRGMIGPAALLEFLTAFTLSMLPLGYLATRLDNPRHAFLLLVATAIPFLPLYVVAVDWGRWISLHTFSYVVLVLVGLQVGAMRLQRSVPTAVLWSFLGVELVIANSHLIGLDWGGLLQRLALTGLALWDFV